MIIGDAELLENGDYGVVGSRVVYASEVECAALWGKGLGSSHKGLPKRLAALHNESIERRVERELKRMLLKKIYFPHGVEGRVMSDRAARMALAKLHELERRKITIRRRDLERIVDEVMRQLNLQPRRKGRGRRPRLAEEQIRELLRLRRRGASLRQIAKHFGISLGTAYNYVKRTEAFKNG